MINIPEIIILNSFKSVLKKIRDDYKDNLATPTKSLLYLILNGNEVQRYQLFEEAKTVLITTEADPRHIDINLFFNAKRAHLPTLHITLPSESEKNNALGESLGFQDTIYDDDTNEHKEVYNRRFGARYNMIVTSDNTNEVILMYHFFRSIIISLRSHFHLAGLENTKISGGDIQINSDLVPNSIFIRSIGLEFEYDVKGIELFNNLTLPFDILVDSVPLEIK